MGTLKSPLGSAQLSGNIGKLPVRVRNLIKYPFRVKKNIVVYILRRAIKGKSKTYFRKSDEISYINGDMENIKFFLFI